MTKNKENIRLKKEKFMSEICKKNGWNINELTANQHMIISRKYEKLNNPNNNLKIK